MAIDIAILRPRDDFYAAAHPHPEDVLIAIEVADSSLEYDRTEKLLRYARAGIAEVWIVDIGSQTVEQYTQPGPTRYHRVQFVGHSEQITAAAIDQLVFPIDALFR